MAPGEWEAYDLEKERVRNGGWECVYLEYKRGEGGDVKVTSLRRGVVV